MTAAEKAATPIFDGVVAEAGLDWPEDETTGGPADEGKRAGAGK
ncbi:hypothetical protein [Amycolatopsis benzoatilytica]|nr:hypothetical protein [Amycolatopsis benzoatilytica]